MQRNKAPGVVYIFPLRANMVALALCLLIMLVCPQTAFTEHKILINKGTNQLAFYIDDLLIDVFPVATGRLPHYTPEGNWQVVSKLVYPAWRPPGGGALIPGGIAANPLGPRWLGLNALGTAGSSYGIHGNNSPYSIGTYASSGCIRMYNEDILWLYEHVPIGANVQIVSTGQDLQSLKKYNQVYINGVRQEFASCLGLLHAGDTTYLSLRNLASILGCRLTWESASNSLIAANIDSEVQLTIGKNTVTANNTTYETNDAPVLLEDTTYIPDYYLRDFFGAVFLAEENKILQIKLPISPSDRNLVKHHFQLLVNGEDVYLPESCTPLIEDENLLVPLRPLCAATGAEVEWNVNKQSVEVKTKGHLLSIPIDGSPALFDNDILDQKTHIFIHNGATFINLDFLKKPLCWETTVDYSTRTLKITYTKRARIATRILPPVQMSLRTV